jgi:putative transcriptional regulator
MKGLSDHAENDSSDPKPAQPMTDAQLAAWEASRDLEAELLESMRQYKRGEVRVVYPPSPVTAKGGDTPQP